MNNKVLYFEGAGCVPRGDVENCRIRTAFVNDDGKQIYLELIGVTPHQHMSAELKSFQNVAFVDYCCYITEEKPNDDYNKNRLPVERKVHFEYSKEGILNFVNTYLNCSFESIIITDMFDGYHVHAHAGGHNLMNEFVYRPERAARAREAFNRVDMEIREKLGEKYSKISLYNLGDYAMTVRCYASNESMRKHGLDPNKRLITVMI